jgi:[acyl-carrier-protein] S-malonyltransferase
MKTAFIFPGQGAQVVGMAADVVGVSPVAAELFARADEIVGYSLSEICFEGPAEDLNSTAISQPAIFVTSAAILACLRSNPTTANIRPDVTAGLSLGEYTALYAAGAISFEDALILVQKRGSAMQAASEATTGGMVSILGLDEEKARQLCAEAAAGDLLEPVNFNCPGQIVLSGTVEACRRAVGLGEKYGAMKTVPLKVAGAFHTEMMTPAAEALKLALDKCKIADQTDIKVIANVDAQFYTNARQIRRGLVNQLVGPVLWQKCVEKLLDKGVETFYEIGPGRVLTGLMKRISRKIKVINISSLESISKVRPQPCLK